MFAPENDQPAMYPARRVDGVYLNRCIDGPVPPRMAATTAAAAEIIAVVT
jgi:hypothetical protein